MTIRKERAYISPAPQKDRVMGMLDGLVEGMVGAEMVYVVNGILQKHGGMQGVMGQLQSQGLGPSVSSWMSEGPTAAPATPDQMHQAFGTQTINDLAAKSGLTPDELAQKLAQVLPHAVSASASTGTPPPPANP
jgi:uncharacterized protein YidB (DUF937 family)